MGYRQVYIKKAKKLSFKDNQLVITRDEESNNVPLEDINFIILDSYETIITARLLTELSKHYICLIVCDEFHEPKTITYSYNHHYKQLEVLETQLLATESFNDILWKKIIEFKIKNQLCLINELESNNEEAIKKLSDYLNEVEIGDITNREGLASKIYFRALFGHNFIRFYDDAINMALNYGYTILKSAITRSLVAHGLLPYLGIHHKSKTNNFNLAYDLIEPYRPIIDKYVYQNMERLTTPLSFEIRKELIDLLNEQVLINNKFYTVQFSIDVVVQSYIKSLEENKNNLLLPSLITKK
ncbi:MAG: type II CRISPR-associated endonuclease Cas1 [Mollicutes bacterium]|nr:type II CRISPR-associated endonuclease Cas1 [Mollicutes bacterium]